MFEFLTSGKETTDPLANPKTVAQWLRQLPALDVIGRQQHVMNAFEAMRKGRRRSGGCATARPSSERVKPIPLLLRTSDRR